MTAPRFAVPCQLTGTDGNAFAIIGNVVRALRKGGATEADIAEFQAEAMSGDYDHLLITATRWVEVS